MASSTHIRLLAVIVAVLFLAGCLDAGFLPGDDEEVSLDTLRSDLESVDSYHVEVTRTLQSDAVNETTRTRGVVDRAERRGRFSQRMITDLGTADRESRNEQYLIDGTLYLNRSGDWESRPYDEEYWAEVDRLGAASGVLESTDLTRIRTETVGGTETTMYRLNLTETQRQELIGIGDTEHVPLSIEEFAYYIYVDTDTGMLRKTDLRTVVTQGAEPALLRIETTFSEFDEPVDITLPSDAP